MDMRRWKSLFIVAVLVASPTIVLAQQQTSQSPNPKSSGEIAKASRTLAQTNERCRLQAKEKKLKLVKRRRFIRDCVRRSTAE